MLPKTKDTSFMFGQASNFPLVPKAYPVHSVDHLRSRLSKNWSGDGGQKSLAKLSRKEYKVNFRPQQYISVPGYTQMLVVKWKTWMTSRSRSPPWAGLHLPPELRLKEGCNPRGRGCTKDKRIITRNIASLCLNISIHLQTKEVWEHTHG